MFLYRFLQFHFVLNVILKVIFMFQRRLKEKLRRMNDACNYNNSDSDDFALGIDWKQSLLTHIYELLHCGSYVLMLMLLKTCSYLVSLNLPCKI